jgi:hypothetical protein
VCEKSILLICSSVCLGRHSGYPVLAQENSKGKAQRSIRRLGWFAIGDLVRDVKLNVMPVFLMQFGSA